MLQTGASRAREPVEFLPNPIDLIWLWIALIHRFMNQLEKMKQIALRHTVRGARSTGLLRLDIVSITATTDYMPFMYSPLCCLILQGAKRALIGDEALEYGVGKLFVASAEVPALGQITQASAQKPYLALLLHFDPALIATILLDIPPLPEAQLTTALSVGSADEDLLDSWYRMARLIERPHEIPVLGKSVERELLYRLIDGPQGHLLRQIAGTDGRLSQIRKTLVWIQSNFAQVIRVEELAEIAGMSAPVFHRHFKAVTSMTPIQFQKHARLLEARRLLAANPGDVTGAAFSVGYESASQFSREYTRMFGSSPTQDLKRLKA